MLERFHRLKRALTIAITDDIAQQIAILKGRLVALDRFMTGQNLVLGGG